MQDKTKVKKIIIPKTDIADLFILGNDLGLCRKSK